MKRLPPPSPLPTAADCPKDAFHSGWWSGLAVGFINGLALAVIAWKGLL